MRKKVIDHTGYRFGRWTILAAVGKNHHGTVVYHIRCDCGTEKFTAIDGIKRGDSQSCGCLRVEQNSKPRKHGLTGHYLYSTWANIKHRCYNSNSKLYPLYGGRKIAMCDAWKNDFAQFLKDMGDRPPGTSIDRIDVNGPYSPENCRWATATTQHNNTRSNRFITYNGITKTASEWAREMNMCVHTIYDRLKRGWTVEDTLSKPVNSVCNWREK